VDDLIAVAERGQSKKLMHYVATFDRWYEAHVFPIEAERFGALFWDVTDRVKSEERQRLLLRELSHRVKNTLSVVQSMAMQTARRHRSQTSFIAEFQSRLLALARAHDILLQCEWAGAPLDEVVRKAVEPYTQHGAMKIDTSACSADTVLTPVQTLALALALHELATNAIKHGSLSMPGGRVTITCTQPNGEATLEWVERGGPPITGPPEEQGFGLRLLRRETGGEGVEADLRFEAPGVRCTFRLLKQPSTDHLTNRR
jgi:two-component sensor histidine kinase